VLLEFPRSLGLIRINDCDPVRYGVVQGRGLPTITGVKVGDNLMSRTGQPTKVTTDADINVY
jgi:hypothetical protein